MERFYSKVRVNTHPHLILRTPCHEWTATKQKEGYGRFVMDGKIILAHRMSWELEIGIIPDGMFVLHKCDNPSCVNKKHLFLGSKSDNMKDMWDKNRHPVNNINGENAPWAKLKSRQIKTILHELKSYKRGMCKELAKKYNVSLSTISAIKSGRTWNESRKESAYLR